MSEKYSDELLNAYVDGELDHEESRLIERDMDGDEELRARIAELESLKQMVTSAYADVKPQRPAERASGGWSTLSVALAASLAAFAVGVAVTLGVLSYTTDSRVSQLVQGSDPAGRYAPATQGVVKVLFHLSRDEPERLNAILNEAEALLSASRQMGKSVSVRVVASGAGLSLFEEGAAAQAIRRIGSMKQTYRDQLVFNGCSVAYKQLRAKRANGEFDLIPEIELVDLGVLELMRRQKQGWAYIRI